MLRKIFSISPQFCLKSHFSNDHLFLFPVNVPLYIWMEAVIHHIIIVFCRYFSQRNMNRYIKDLVTSSLEVSATTFNLNTKGVRYQNFYELDICPQNSKCIILFIVQAFYHKHCLFAVSLNFSI